VARILLTVPPLPEARAVLAGHDVVEGPPGADSAADALVCAATQPVDAGAIAAMERLRVISVAGAGLDAVDERAAAARDIAVFASGEPLVETTADLAFGLIIAAARQFAAAEARLREGRWRGWSYVEPGFGIDVHGARLGLIGFGRIARAVARRADAFAIQTRHHTRFDTGEAGWTASLDELLPWAEIVSLHVPLTDQTRGMIDARRIAAMRRGAVLVNTARGAVVDEAALVDALASGHLFAAGLDVYEDEPNVSPALLAAPRTILLPHIGSATLAARTAMLVAAAEKAVRFLAAGR